MVRRAVTRKAPDSTRLNRIVLDPRLLSRIRYTALPREADERVGPGRDVVHLTEQRHEERRFAGSGRTDDQVELPALEEELLVHVKSERPLATASRGDRELGRVVRPSEGCIANPDSVRFRDGRAQDHRGFGLGFGERIDELSL